MLLATIPFLNLVQFNGVVNIYNTIFYLYLSSVHKIVFNKSIFWIVPCDEILPSWLIAVLPSLNTKVSPFLNYIKYDSHDFDYIVIILLSNN